MPKKTGPLVEGPALQKDLIGQVGLRPSDHL
jgi:hypothetical protein